MDLRIEEVVYDRMKSLWVSRSVPFIKEMP
ncbi:hypothetical protein P3T22_006426 [Paraburkholderia sp. GAS348]